MNKILSKLSEQQSKAVTYKQGPLLVLAGPGAGKTTVLARRIAYILSESKGEHFKILALTFTNKAAREMKERVENLVGEEVKRTFIGTFHAFSHDLIRSYGNYIGISQDFIIYDKSEDYIKLLIDGVRKRVNGELKGEKPKVLSEKYRDIDILTEEMPNFYYLITKLKNKSIFFDGLNKFGKMYSEEFKLIFEIYNEGLEEARVLDFPDLILYANKLMKEKPFIAKQIQKINRHILIDEGQDTNKSQFELITNICSKDFRNLFIVADEDQLIFEWNDARFEYLMSLVKKYKAETIQLYESYRCPPKILKVANLLIKHNMIRIATKEDLLPEKGITEGSIVVNEFDTQDEEACYICNNIKKLKRYTDTCIISRNRYLFENIKERLDEQSVPYYILMGQERFSSREMNFIINLMRLIFNENDKVHLNYVCEYLKIDYEKVAEGKSEETLLQRFIASGKNNQKLKDIINILSQFRNGKTHFKTHYDRLKKLIIGLNGKSEDILEDIKLFEETYKHYTFDKKGSERNLGDFLNYLSLSPKKDLKDSGIALLTGHAAKGLEFDYVFLISMNQGIFPDYRAKKESRSLEEERRNCFVAVTRTKKKLFISYTRSRKTRCGPRQHEVSQFLKEMELVK